MTQAHARRSDPQTSHDAAASVVGLRPKQEAVWRVLSRSGPSTHEELVERYRLSGEERQSESGIRTRCNELAGLGRVTATGKRKLVSGRMAVVWAAI